MTALWVFPPFPSLRRCRCTRYSSAVFVRTNDVASTVFRPPRTALREVMRRRRAKPFGSLIINAA